MARAVSTRFWDAIQQAYTDEDFTILLTISHVQLSTPIYIANDTVDITSNSILYTGVPFDFIFPGESDIIERGQLVVQNVDRRMGFMARAIRTPPQIDLQVVLRAAPNTVEFRYRYLELRNLEVNDFDLKGDISVPDYSIIPAFAAKCNSERYPGAFLA